MRLLLVEDEVDLADTLADGLRREGYLVDVARDGASALTAAASNDVDVIVLDRDLPVLSGAENAAAAAGAGLWSACS